MTSDKKISLRPVTEKDDEFLLSVYAGTREDELKQVPWAPEQKEAFVRMQFEAQKRHYAAQYPKATHEIICVDGVPVGRIYLSRGAEGFHILDITVVSQHRNAGTGSYLLRKLLDEAKKAARPVSVYVESYNPSLRLFSRLGFRKLEDNGMTFLLQWAPESGSQASE